MPAELHRGEACEHLIRRDYEPADCRCRKAIERYGTPTYSFLDSLTWVPVKVGAEELGLPLSETLRRVKAGELKARPRASAEPRVTVQDKGKTKEVTPKQAAKLLKIPLNDVRQRIADGKLEHRHLDEHLEIEITTRWAYERCLLWRSAGICSDFEKCAGRAQKTLFSQ